METSDSDYFESADEDLHSSDEDDKRKTKIISSLHTSLHTKSETRKKLHSLHLQENEQNTRSIPEKNKITTREETRLTDLINENLKLGSENNTCKERDVEHVTTEISLIDNAVADARKEVKLNTDYKEKALVMCNSDMKKEIIGLVKNNEDQTPYDIVRLNKKDAGDNEIVESNDKFDNVWHEVVWHVVDDVGKNTTKIKDSSQNTSDAIKENTSTNETNKSNNECDNTWHEVDWIIDFKKDRGSILDNVEKNTEIKDNTQNTSNVIEENMWENDEWEPIEEEEINCVKSDSVKQATSTAEGNIDSHIWGKWGNWGVSSVLSTATQSVSTLTTSVSQGISTVLESSMGVPDPEELARLNHTEEKQRPHLQNKNNLDDEYQNKNLLGFGFGNIGNLVSGVSKLVESTSTKVISGGLDTLETIGKKTMEVLQEGDPGLKKKRAFLKLNVERPVLSQVLREAKEKVEQENEKLDKPIVKKINYETLFDDHQGLVHLEALEMLSKQCEFKLQTLIESCTGETLLEIQETVSQVKELCELPDEDEHELTSSNEIKERLKSVVDEISIRITYDKLICIWEDTELWLNNLEPGVCDELEIHQRAIETLARLTAVVVEQFHKTGELLFIKDHHNTADEADGLVQLTTILTSVISIVAGKFSEKLNAKALRSAKEEEINSLITNVFFEAANSSSYIQDAFQLLVPVLQIGSVKV